jgi:hypothetical protein
LPSVMYSATVFIMNSYYRKLATLLTEWGKWHTIRHPSLLLLTDLFKIFKIFFLCFLIPDRNRDWHCPPPHRLVFNDYLRLFPLSYRWASSEERDAEYPPPPPTLCLIKQENNFS